MATDLTAALLYSYTARILLLDFHSKSYSYKRNLSMFSGQPLRVVQLLVKKRSLGEFRITCFLRGCNFVPEFGPKLNIRTFWKRNKFTIWDVISTKSAFSKALLWSRVKKQLWSTFKLFKCAISVQIRSKTLVQNCICEGNSTCDTESSFKHFSRQFPE